MNMKHVLYYRPHWNLVCTSVPVQCDITVLQKDWGKPCGRAFLDLAYFGGHPRYIFAPLGLSQPGFRRWQRFLLGNLAEFLCFLRVYTLLRTRYVHAASGLLSWSIELLAFASRQFAPRIVDLSVRFIHLFALCSVTSLWASVAGGGSRPRSEAPCVPC